MTNDQDTTRVQNDNLTKLRPETIRTVLAAVARVGKERGDIERAISRMLNGGGLGLLAADAVTQASRRLGLWAAIDRVEAFLTGFQVGDLDTEGVRWARGVIARIRLGDLDIRGADGGSDAARRKAIEGEWVERTESAAHWLERCMIRLVELALWWWLEEYAAMCTDDVGLFICDELVSAGRENDAHEFVAQLRSLGGRGRARAA